MNDAMLSVGISQLSPPQIYGKHVIVVNSYPASDLIWRTVVSVLQASVSCHCNLYIGRIELAFGPPIRQTDLLDHNQKHLSASWNTIL